MTAHAMRGDRDACLTAGMDAYLAKPLDARELVALVERLAGQESQSLPAAVEEAPVPEIASGFDFSPALRRMDGDRELFQQLSAFFADDGPHLVAQLRNALATGNATAFERAAHSLKGLTRNFEAVDAAALAEKLERRGREGNLDGGDQELAALDLEVRRLLAALDDFDKQTAPTAS
jgi:HPt (histidine-containing phosphotransfer) domain-containing protein